MLKDCLSEGLQAFRALATGPVATVLKNTRVDEKRRAVARRAKSACSAVDTRPTLPSSRRGGGDARRTLPPAWCSLSKGGVHVLPVA